MKLEPQEFERLAIEQMDSVYRLARRLSRDVARAEDLVQETYLRALRSRDSFTLEDFGIRPWLLRILYNVHISRAQQEGRRPVAMDDQLLELIDESSLTIAPISPGSFDAMDQRLVRALESLPEEYQSVLLMWAVEDLSYKEIAEILGIPIGTVMSRLHRARQRLTDQLRDLALEERIIRK